MTYEGEAAIGVYGLGTMGSALALNLADKGFDVVVSNREADWITPFLERAGPLAARLTGAEGLEDFVAAIARPRKILFMIPSGAPMDAMIAAISPLLDPGDIMVDGGNADFNDTRRRGTALEGSGLNLVGMGVSGGETGARFGPSMMVGGSAENWETLRPVLEPISAKFKGDPCVAHMGPDGAGHFVKTVHNGMEYADMQMISEVYGLMRDAGGQSAPAIGKVFEAWKTGPLASYLIDVTAAVLQTPDAATGEPVVDVILDKAGQKGTGRWTLIEALKLGQSTSTIEGAVAARSWSAELQTRAIAERMLPALVQDVDLPGTQDMQAALIAGRILAHAQGFRVLSAAAEAYDWPLDLARISEIWRAGCIIRSAMLDTFAAAFREAVPGGHLILSPAIITQLDGCIGGLRRVVASAALLGVAVPSLSAALAWYDTMRRARGHTNLIQAQRDFFGAHGFERIGEAGAFHGDWPQLDEPL
jgi:6-phosphogluconate dehydrogenase